MDKLSELQRILLDALGLHESQNITHITIDVLPNKFPTVTIEREFWNPAEAEPLSRVLTQYTLTPKDDSKSEAIVDVTRDLPLEFKAAGKLPPDGVVVDEKRSYVKGVDWWKLTE